MKKLTLAFSLVCISLASVNLGAQINQPEYQARRARLAAKMDSVTAGRDWILYASGGEEPAEDYLTFNQKPRFEYLTGFHEPSAGLVMIHHAGAPMRQILFVQPRDPSREKSRRARFYSQGSGNYGGRAARRIPNRSSRHE